MTQIATEVGASALSCLTANLSTYLVSTMDDPFGWIARSIRLGVRLGATPAISHHRYTIASLGGERQLAYRGTDDPAIVVQHLAEQIVRYAGVLVVAYSGAMPWSLAERENTAPHLVLVTGRARRSWHVNDAFSALLPSGQQEPFDGLIGTTMLLRALRTPSALAAEQRQRIRHAFGPALHVPEARYRWLEPVPAEPIDEPQWMDDPNFVLPALGAFFAELPTRAQYIDDIWAAAQHHTFRYTYLLRHHQLTGNEAAAVDAAAAAWAGLPMALHFAADSARRNKPRPSLVATAFRTLLEAEQRCAPILIRLAYAATPDRVPMKGKS